MIELHQIAIIKSQSMINLGAFLCLFPLSMYSKVGSITENLEKNKLFASDVKDLIHLANILIERDELSDLLKEDIVDLIKYLNLKIVEFSHIPKSCARHTEHLGI